MVKKRSSGSLPPMSAEDEAAAKRSYEGLVEHVSGMVDRLMIRTSDEVDRGRARQSVASQLLYVGLRLASQAAREDLGRDPDPKLWKKASAKLWEDINGPKMEWVLMDQEEAEKG